MIVGIPKESKVHEYRVAMTVNGVRALTNLGHQVIIQKSAGLESGFPDSEYIKAKASVCSSYHQLVKKSDLVLKVKEPSLKELESFSAGQTLFTFLHLAPNPKLTRALVRKKITALGYETVELEDHSLPLLKPMSAIAGRMASQVGAHYLKHDQGGIGLLMGGIAGARAVSATVLGAGTVGQNAVDVAVGMGAMVNLFDIHEERAESVSQKYPGRVKSFKAEQKQIELILCETDLLIGAVLIPGASAPKLVTREMVKKMKKGSVIVDVSVDQGGCVETSRPTTHAKPVYLLDGVLHYGVTNIPGCVPYTATRALVHATLPYILELANRGIEKALSEIPELKGGLNVWKGEVVHPGIAI